VACLHGLADLVGPAGIVEHALGGRRLAGVDMRHDADISVSFERVVRAMTKDSSRRRSTAPEDRDVLPARASRFTRALPRLVRERFVRSRPYDAYLPFFYRDTAVIGGIEQFARKPLFHLFSERPRELEISQRIANAWLRSVRTSIGT